MPAAAAAAANVTILASGMHQSRPPTCCCYCRALCSQLAASSLMFVIRTIHLLQTTYILARLQFFFIVVFASFRYLFFSELCGRPIGRIIRLAVRLSVHLSLRRSRKSAVTCKMKHLQKKYSLIVMGLPSFKFSWWLVGSERRMRFETECIMAIQSSHPRSLILTPIESAYATSYWSSIVGPNLGPILPRFIKRYCRFSAEKSDPTPITLEFWECSPWTRLPMLWLQGAKTLS